MSSDLVRERLREFDAGAMALPQLMAIGFAKSPGALESNGPAVADYVDKKGRNPATVLGISISELADHFGLDEFEAKRALALLEIGRKAALVERRKVDPIDTVESAYEAVKDLAHETREHFVVLFCDSQLQVRGRKTIHIGTLTASMVGMREVFREAIREAASTIIVAHNHPSGDPTPSPEDLEVTKKLVEVGRLLDIPVVDHIIVGNGTFTSLKRRRLM